MIVWVLAGNGLTLIDLARCSRVFIAERCDAVLVSAAIERTDIPVTLCKCASLKAAIETLQEIAQAIDEGEYVWFAPENFADRQYGKVHDARAKRRGGS